MSRLNPTITTITKLVLASGGRCAFPSCDKALIEGDQLIGQICHIEAASKGGQRYNPAQTDDERRGVDNLILLCANHHKVTDNVESYPADALHKMKSDHESKIELEPPMELSQIEHVLNPQQENIFRYKLTDSFTPYKEYEYRNDLASIHIKLNNEIEKIRRVAPNNSALGEAQRRFSLEKAIQQSPFKDRKQNSEKMYDLEKRRIEEFYTNLEQSEMSKLVGRGMGHSGQVIVLQDKLQIHKAQAFEELDIMYGKGNSIFASD